MYIGIISILTLNNLVYIVGLAQVTSPKFGLALGGEGRSIFSSNFSHQFKLFVKGPTRVLFESLVNIKGSYSFEKEKKVNYIDLHKTYYA